MSGQPCSVCFRWYKEAYHIHNARHIAENPHTFCRTMNCGQKDCPVREGEAK